MKILNYINFRFNQFLRLFNYESDFSAINIILLLCIIFFNFNKYPLLFIFPISIIHFQRKDINFLKKIFVHYRLIILSEYTFLYVFFIILNIHYKINFESLYLYLIVITIIFIPPYKKSEHSFINWKIIPNTVFEWKSFLRKKSLIFIGYFIGLLFSTYHPFTLFLIGIFYLDFISYIYKNNENKELLKAFFKKYTFIKKIKFNILIFNITLLPTFFIYTIINYTEFKYLLHYILSMNFYLLLIISRKYSVYNYKIQENKYNTGIFIKYLICSFLLIPFFPIFKENYKNAIENIYKF